MKSLTIIKIGGNVLDNPDLLTLVLNHFASLPDHKILIHGGGKIANVLMKQLGIEPVMVEGRRITDKKTLEIVTMVYAGWINKSIVVSLQALHCNALGLTGADGNCIPAVKRPVKAIDYGFVGDITTSEINNRAIKTLLEQEFTPVFAPITHDTTGNLLNTNADTIASSIAISMASLYTVKLIYCFEKNGVLSDPNDDQTVIHDINESSYNDLKAVGIIHSGMIPKLDNAFAALKSGVSQINICGPLAFKKTGTVHGTCITL